MFPNGNASDTCDSFAPLRTGTWTSLLYDLEARLTALAPNGGGYLVLNVARSDDPFVQFVVGEGSIDAEAASTVAADGQDGLRHWVDPSTEEQLLRLGWHAPEDDPLQLAQPGQRPNFYRHEVAPAAVLFAELGVRTLVEAFRVDDPGLVQVRGAYLPEGMTPLRM